MKSDLTCPVEIIRVQVRREEKTIAEEPKKVLVKGEVAIKEGEPETRVQEQIICDIEFQNLSQKETASIQMNIICYDADNQRLGGRLVRSRAESEPRGCFSGVFMPEHVEGTTRVEASVEKVWYKDGMLWRREERNVREYTPNRLPEGRELDRLRAVAGPDAAGYAREDDTVWMCVCGRANRTSDDVCMRCERRRTQVLEDYSFAAIDSTVGRKERSLEEKSRETLRKSSAQTVRQMNNQKKQEKKRRRRMRRIIAALALFAALLAFLRWGLPWGVNLYAQQKLDAGLAADAKQAFAWVHAYWPNFGDAGKRAEQAETIIIRGMIDAGSDEMLEAAAKRAYALGTQEAMTLHEEAVIARAELAWNNGEADEALALYASLPQSKAAADKQQKLVYEIACAAQEQVDYPQAIERFAQLGDYEDAAARREDCIYLYGRQLMREGRYEEATAQFMQVTGMPDAIALIRQCRYAIAQAAQESGAYIAAAEAYESLGVYEEAETRAKVCRYEAGMELLAAGDLASAAQQLRLAEDYEDAQARFADAAYTLGFTALEEARYTDAILWLEQLEREGDTADALDRAMYAYAGELEAAGMRDEAAIQYGLLGSYSDAQERANALTYAIALEEMGTSVESALSRFEALGSYADSAEQADACRYALAQAHYAEAEYEAALSLFEELGGYSDAKNQLRRTRYAYAEQLFGAQRFDEAAAQYEACGAYLQAEEMTLRARYEAAAALEAAGMHKEAALAFAALGSYDDAKARVTRNEDNWLQATYNSAWLDMDLGDYDSVIKTLDPLQGETLPERYAQIEDMYLEACLMRSEALIEQGRPLDALPVLERIAENKTAKKRLDAYVYKLIGRWKDTKGTEYVFRRDGTCSINGEEMYYGGSGYGIFLSDAPYPTQRAYLILSLKKGVFTLHDEKTDKDFRLTYLGEPESVQEESDGEN